MKKHLLVVVIFGNFTILRAHQPKQARVQLRHEVAPKPPQLHPDVRDQMLFAQGLAIAANLGKIFLDPHNIPAVKQNAAGLIDGVVNFMTTAMRRLMIEPDSTPAPGEEGMAQDQEIAQEIK